MGLADPRPSTPPKPGALVSVQTKQRQCWVPGTVVPGGLAPLPAWLVPSVGEQTDQPRGARGPTSGLSNVDAADLPGP